MTTSRSRFGASLAALAAFSMSAAPALAHGGGWGWNDWGRYRHRDRVDAGDVLTGILIVGGIVAIANAASTRDRDRERRRDDRRERDESYPQDGRYGDRGRDYRAAPAPSWNDNDLSGAVDRCSAEVERDGSRARIDTVNREGDGWRVQGQSGDGKTFSCSIDASGQVRNVAIEGEARSEAEIEDDSAAVIDVETEVETDE